MTPQEQLCEKMRVEQSAYCLLPMADRTAARRNSEPRLRVQRP